MNAVLRGDVHSIRIGAYSNVQDGSVLHGMKEQYGVFLGGYVTVGHSVILHGCTIEDRCLIGMGSIILNGARIGAGSIIAAGTLIPEKTVVEPGSLWMGSPGQVPPQTGGEGSGNDHALRAGIIWSTRNRICGRGNASKATGALRPRLQLVVARIKICFLMWARASSLVQAVARAGTLAPTLIWLGAAARTHGQVANLRQHTR